MEKQDCLHCHYFRVKDIASGICRLAKGADAPRPTKQHGDLCAEFRDSGQQYYIRQGWLKSQAAQQEA
ncbi:MAG: hypothetical protein ABFR97_08230 [Thermodesulfobacteriota bacterium]